MIYLLSALGYPDSVVRYIENGALRMICINCTNLYFYNKEDSLYKRHCAGFEEQYKKRIGSKRVCIQIIGKEAVGEPSEETSPDWHCHVEIYTIGSNWRHDLCKKISNENIFTYIEDYKKVYLPATVMLVMNPTNSIARAIISSYGPINHILREDYVTHRVMDKLMFYIKIDKVPNIKGYYSGRSPSSTIMMFLDFPHPSMIGEDAVDNIGSIGLSLIRKCEFNEAVNGCGIEGGWSDIFSGSPNLRQVPWGFSVPAAGVMFEIPPHDTVKIYISPLYGK